MKLTKAEKKRFEELINECFYTEEEALKSIEKDRAYVKYCRTERKDWWERG